ncbi:MAG: hypothetical protein ACE5LF_07945 [Alphaproteobacteria bacterium]
MTVISETGPIISETSPSRVHTAESTARGHFWVDINKLFRIFGKRYFVIFYFGRHLHPRQSQLVNQRTWGNGAIVLLFLILLGGFAYGMVELTAYRMSQNALACIDASYQLTSARQF